MQTTKKTIQQIEKFVIAANKLLNPKHEPQLEKTSKLYYAISRVTKGCMELLGNYNEQREDVQIAHCSVDEKGNMLKDQNGQQLIFTPAKLKECNDRIRELYRKEQHDAPQYIATDLPTWLKDEPFDILDALDDFVLKLEEPKFEVVKEVANA